MNSSHPLFSFFSFFTELPMIHKNTIPRFSASRYSEDLVRLPTDLLQSELERLKIKKEDDSASFVEKQKIELLRLELKSRESK